MNELLFAYSCTYSTELEDMNNIYVRPSEDNR